MADKIQIFINDKPTIPFYLSKPLTYETEITVQYFTEDEQRVFSKIQVK